MRQSKVFLSKVTALREHFVGENWCESTVFLPIWYVILANGSQHKVAAHRNPTQLTWSDLANHFGLRLDSYFFEYSVKSRTKSGQTPMNSRSSSFDAALLCAASGTWFKTCFCVVNDLKEVRTISVLFDLSLTVWTMVRFCVEATWRHKKSFYIYQLTRCARKKSQIVPCDWNFSLTVRGTGFAFSAIWSD